MNKFVMLDGIRGIAALFVLTRHTREFWGFNLHHSYLAVDIFFLLSGFVIAHSYEGKLADGRLGVRQFMLIRWIRLYPMYVLSLLLVFATEGLPSATEIARALLVGPTFGKDSLFPLNVVYWSLFFEFWVNLLYALARPVLNTRVLLTVAVGAGLLAAFMGLTVNGMDVGWQGWRYYFAAGLLRAIFGILMGVFLYRHQAALHRMLPSWMGPGFATFVLCVILCLGSFGRMDWWIDVLSVLLIFPLCVVCLTRAPPTWGVKTMAILGAASYPVYLLHPTIGELVLRADPGYIQRFAPASGLLLCALIIAVSLVAERYIDLPIRRRLRNWLLGPRRAPPS